MGGLIKSDPGGLIGVLSGKGGIDLPKPFSKEIFLINTQIACTSHVEGLDALKEKLSKGTRLSFFRELDNEYDKLAVLIKDDQGNKLGYVSKEKNEIISRLMDAGKLIYGKLIEIETKGKWLKIEIEVYLQD
jgi:hypothetical protein